MGSVLKVRTKKYEEKSMKYGRAATRGQSEGETDRATSGTLKNRGGEMTTPVGATVDVGGPWLVGKVSS